MKRLLTCTTAIIAGTIFFHLPAYATETIANSIVAGETVNLTNINPTNNVTAGQMAFTLSTSSGGGIIDAWCIDMFHHINTGSNDYFFTSGTLNTNTTDGDNHTLTQGEVNKMAGLMEIGNGVLDDGATTNALNLSADNAHYGNTAGATAAQWSAAIQLAIWSTEYSANFPTLTFTGGSTLTHTIFADLVADGSITGSANDLIATGTQQSFGYSTLSINLDAVPTPEPASIALLGFGLLGTIAFARRRRA